MKPFDLTPPFTRDDIEIVQRERVYQGFFALDRISLRHRLYAGGWSRTLSREMFIRTPAVGVLLYDPVHDLIGLVEQVRMGAYDEDLSPWCLEVVAGMVEAGETTEAVARREVLEETGLTVSGLEFLCDYIASPGGSTEKMYLYCACVNLAGAGGIYGLAAEAEDIRLRVLDAEKVLAALYAGRFNNAASLISLQWLQRQRPRLQQEAQAGGRDGDGETSLTVFDVSPDHNGG